jgi:hypothetical protein
VEDDTDASTGDHVDHVISARKLLEQVNRGRR